MPSMPGPDATWFYLRASFLRETRSSCCHDRKPASMVSATRTMTLRMGQGRGYINCQDFDVDPYPY